MMFSIKPCNISWPRAYVLSSFNVCTRCIPTFSRFSFIPHFCSGGLFHTYCWIVCWCFCADFGLKVDWILGFYGPSSPIADATCGIFMACLLNYHAGIATMVSQHCLETNMYFHIAQLWDIFYLIASVLIRLSKCPISWSEWELEGGCKTSGGSRQHGHTLHLNEWWGWLHWCVPGEIVHHNKCSKHMQTLVLRFQPNQQREDHSSCFVLLSCSWSLHLEDRFVIYIQDRAKKWMCNDRFAVE